MKLYLATGNAHKVDELRRMLDEAGVAIEVFSAKAVGGMPDVVEDAGTYTGNALKKAWALAEKLEPGAWALADDSGVDVDALGGAPGVYSARYAGENATDEENVVKLLNALATTPDEERSASFRCHLALVQKGSEPVIFEGACYGTLLHETRGSQGFGYDPLFVPDGYTLSFGEMSGDEKAALSHRGDAVAKLIDWLKTR